MKQNASSTSAEFSALPYLPDSLSLTRLRAAAARCQGCPLYAGGTQTVFGQGPRNARLMLLGETSGDQEDLNGHPFVGRAGQLLDEVLERAEIDRGTIYVTNAVKHFKWSPRGKRRLHAKPSSREIVACRPWLEAEIASVSPELIVCLGATAAQTLLGRAFRITRSRGEILEPVAGPPVLATFHPSAVLRAPERSARQEMRRQMPMIWPGPPTGSAGAASLGRIKCRSCTSPRMRAEIKAAYWARCNNSAWVESGTARCGGSGVGPVGH